MLAQLARETLTLDLTLDFARKMHFETKNTIEVNYPRAFFLIRTV
jgi:hypothetical protein